MAFGAQLKRAREEAGITGRHLATLAGLSSGYISLLESGNREMVGSDVGLRLAKVLGVPLDWLVNGDDSSELPPKDHILAAVERARLAHAEALADAAHTTFENEDAQPAPTGTDGS